jgi:hypothetical protein
VQRMGSGLGEKKKLNAQSVGVRDMAADAQLGGSVIGLSEEAVLQRKAAMGSSGAEQAGGQRGPGRGASVGSGAEVWLQGSEPGRTSARKNLQNFETGSHKSVSFEIAKKCSRYGLLVRG